MASDLAEGLSKVTDRGTQEAIFYILCGRLASGLENHDAGTAQLVSDASQAWEASKVHIRNLAEVDPKQALELGILLTLLPNNDNKGLEPIFQWIRSDGPILLAEQGVKELLGAYVRENPSRGLALGLALMKNMDFQLESMRSKDEVFSDPRSFLAVTSFFLATRFVDISYADSQFLNTLATKAIMRLENRFVSRAVHYYSQISDTSWIVDELEAFLSKEVPDVRNASRGKGMTPIHY